MYRYTSQDGTASGGSRHEISAHYQSRHNNSSGVGVVKLPADAQCSSKRDKAPMQPFLYAHLVPDIILFENEGASGFLTTEDTTGHFR